MRFYGHAGGDFALKSVARFLKGEMGPNDFIARCGEKGDEFAILLDALLGQATETLHESLLRLENTEFWYQSDGQKRPMKIAVSFGLAECGMQDSQE
jgi:diguanylate cyclase (GGDEF)-like protein